jgi:hypothetical protein
MEDDAFLRALRFRWFTRPYDPLVRLVPHERASKGNSFATSESCRTREFSIWDGVSIRATARENRNVTRLPKVQD